MSDAISKAIDTMDLARSVAGPFAVLVTKKLTESIDELKALQSAGQKSERHDWQVVHNGVWESVYKCDKCGKTVTENTDGQDKPIFGCAALLSAAKENNNE